MGPRMSVFISALLVASALLCFSASGKDSVDVSGKWESKYSFGPIEEVMTADIQQVGNSLLGSFTVKQSPSGEEYGGIIFGTVEGSSLKVYYLSAREQDGPDPLVAITFTESTLVGNKLEGTYYYKDSNQVPLSGPYEARRV